MEIQEMTALEAATVLKEDSTVKLLDVRTDEEYRTAHIEGSILMNTHEKAEEIMKLPKDTMLIVHCHHGGRSFQAAGWLMKRGFTKVYNMAGGIESWSTDVDSNVPRY